LQYDKGGFAVTPYIYTQITQDAGGIPDPPIIGIFNPGPIEINKVTNTLAGSKDFNVDSPGVDGVPSHVSWNLQTDLWQEFCRRRGDS
jgi:hypothetical protein